MLSKSPPSENPARLMTGPATDPGALPPVSTDSPCGPDLDLEGDADFMNFLLTMEGQIPKNYYEFKSQEFDFPGTFQIAEKLLRRTHDLRVLVFLVRFSILNRDLAVFAHWFAVIDWLLRNYWEELHPQSIDGDYSERLGQLASLDDPKSQIIILSLKYATLLETSREGSFSYRAQLIATGKEKPYVATKVNERTGQQETSAEEKLTSGKSIERLLREVEVEKISNLFETLSGLDASIVSIETTTIARVGHERAIRFTRLRGLVREMTEFVHGVLVKRDPSLAPPPAPRSEGASESASADGAASASPAFATRTAVDDALGAALGYFAASEPSSPALLLIRQARETLGKNLYEVMKLLTPTHADSARVFVGPDSVFTVPVKSLSNVPPQLEVPREAPPAARSRAAALEMIDAVAAHLRRVEPSSPAPYLLERARNLASRDFLSLLQDVLPEDALAALKKGK
jgi:type VI secretion system protein ImpA